MRISTIACLLLSLAITCVEDLRAQETANDSDSKAPLEAWYNRFAKFDAVRVVWESRWSAASQQNWDGPSYVLDTLMIWPTGLRETVLGPEPNQSYVVTSPPVPGEWDPQVESVSVFGGESGYVDLSPRKYSFIKSPGKYLLSEHAFRWGFRTEWAVARWAAAGGHAKFRPLPERSTEHERAYATPEVTIILHRQPDGAWSMAYYCQTYEGWEYRKTTFADWKVDPSFGWVPGSLTQELFEKQGDTIPSAIQHGKLLLMSNVPEVPDNALTLDLRDARTLDHESREIFDASGKKVGILPSDGLNAGWRWGTVVAIVLAALGVAGIGGYLIWRRQTHARA